MPIVVGVLAVLVPVGVTVWLALEHRGLVASPPETRAARKLAKRAGKAYRGALKSHNRRAEQARRELAVVESQKGRRLGTAGGVTLHERWIDTPEGSGSLIGVTAQAADESSIRQRLTVTRMVTFGLFSLAAPKKTGVGHAYVVIEGPAVSGVATVSARKKSDAGPAAYSFAAKINNAARAAEAAEADRPAAIEVARQRLAEIEGRSDVMAAESEHAAAVAALRRHHDTITDEVRAATPTRNLAVAAAGMFGLYAVDFIWGANGGWHIPVRGGMGLGTIVLGLLSLAFGAVGLRNPGALSRAQAVRGLATGAVVLAAVPAFLVAYHVAGV